MSWNKNPPPGVNPQYSSFHYQNAGYSMDQPRPSPHADNYAHKPGRPGGGWDQDDEPVLRKTANPGHSQMFRQDDVLQPRPRNPDAFDRPAERQERFDAPEVRTVQTSHSEPKHYERKPGLAVSEQPGVYEKILVEEITIPGGVRPRPPDKDLHEFVNKCKYLPPEIIIPLLVSLLDNPQRMFKALCVVERLVYEYESYAEVNSQFLSRIQSVTGNLNTQKVVGAILSRYGAPGHSNPPNPASAASLQSNIIDLF